MLEASSIVAIISVSLAGMTALIHSLFTSLQHSRCTSLKCGCIECLRDPLDKEELEIVNKNIRE
jgi:hypothetical protein